MTHIAVYLANWFTFIEMTLHKLQISAHSIQGMPQAMTRGQLLTAAYSNADILNTEITMLPFPLHRCRHLHLGEETRQNHIQCRMNSFQSDLPHTPINNSNDLFHTTTFYTTSLSSTGPNIFSNV